MQLIRHTDNFTGSLRAGAVTIGNFDGVHRGHARIIERLISKAGNVGGPAVVFTFEPHPVRLLRPEVAPPPLTWTERKAELLADLGVDWIIAYPTDEKLLRLSPREFFEEIVRDQLDARAMVEGPNFFFGRDRAGDIDVLGQLCVEANVDLEIVQPFKLDDDYISSSRVRNAVREGDVRAASQMLTRPYRIRGMVTHGAGRGAKIGFATANIDAIDTLIPADGVYAGRAIASNESWLAAINIGPNPTFGEHAHKVEVHLLDFENSLYGQPLEVDFLARLRDIQPFDSAEELTAQLALDIQRVREVSGGPVV